MRSRFASMLALFCSLAGCVSGPSPQNPDGSLWMPGQASAGIAQTSPALCTDAHYSDTGINNIVDADLQGLNQLVLAPGDRLRIDIAGDTDTLSGHYVVDADGHVLLPIIGRVPAAGIDSEALEQRLRDSLVAQQIIRPLANGVTVRIEESGGVTVGVSGAVFSQGQVRVGERRKEAGSGQNTVLATGDDNDGRTVSSALRAAAGVRPDADISQIVLLRGDRRIVLDMRGLVGGWPAPDPELTSGDRIIVPASSCFDERLAHTGPLTAAGIRVHMSNLTHSAGNNAGAAIGKDTTSLPYGTRFLEALVEMNCVGGSAMQAGRKAVLISRNPATGQGVVVERSIEKLVRGEGRDQENPYLMPGDALACYDSGWTNFREAVGLIGDIAGIGTSALILDRAVK
ncbi:MAG: polysaccharide biosynthesis/export family protein [Sphingomonadaceae bacterium]